MTPFVGPRREELTQRATALLRDALPIDDATGIELSSGVIELRDRSGLVRLVARADQDSPWQLDGRGVRVRREEQMSRSLLRRVSTWFAEPVSAEGLGDLLDGLDSLASLKDEDLCRVEHAGNGETARIRLGFGCNQDCWFCWQGRDWATPPDELVLTWLEEFAAQGLPRLLVSGGEPTTQKVLPELIRRAVGHGMQVSINTNAVRMRRERYTRELVDAGLTTMLVSFHSADAEVSDAMTRARGTWKGTVQGIHNALDAGLVVNLNCLVEKRNVDGLEAHARFVREHFVEAHPDNPVQMVNYSQPGPYLDRDLFAASIVPLDEARPHIQRAGNVLHEAGVLLYLIGTCGFPSCVAHGAEHLVPWRTRDAMDAWAIRGREQPAVCQTCAARDQCAGLRPEYLAAHGARGLVPFEEVPTSDWEHRIDDQARTFFA